MDTLTIPPVYLTDAPVFRKRELWPPVSHPENGTGTDLRALHQALRSYDSWPVKLRVHSPIWSHVEEYTKNRPEIFQLTKDGKRNFEMLCYSNPKTLETYLENIQKHFDGDASAVIGIDGDTITVSPNDQNIDCHCADCQKLWDAKAGKSGAASRIVSTFVAKLDEIAGAVKRANVRDPDTFKKTLDSAVHEYIANVRELRAVVPVELHSGLDRVEADVQQYRFDAALTDRGPLDAYAARTCGRVVNAGTTTSRPKSGSVSTSLPAG